ncbi:MAG: endonuclease/exonuclease/phosphatase family protein [Clostridia bacterium]|nr:endonuclease/exonuclease/phosphatase family protein [Clostridia bacterium]
MKNRHLQAVLALLAAALSLSLLACGKSDEGAVTTGDGVEETAAVTETEAPAPVLTIAENGTSSFVIYRPKTLGDKSLAAVNKLVGAIRAETGASVKVATDWGDAGTKESADLCAILIGETSFPESDVLDGLKLTQYIITAEGNKLIIGGVDDEGTTAAIDAFIEQFVTGKGSTLTFSADETVLDKGSYPEDSYMSCLGAPIEHYRIVIPADADLDVLRCATQIAARLTRLTGVRYPLLTDAEATDTGAREILIGNTARTTLKVDPYSYDISAAGNTVQVVADSHYAYEEAAYIFTTEIATLRKPTPITETTHRRADLSAELKQSSPSLMERNGEVRVLIHNIWGNTSEGRMDDRMRQTAILYECYAPDVIGLQECSPGARSGNYGMVSLLRELGYVEVPAKSTNTSGNNYTPLFYNEKTVRPVEYGYRLYAGQNDSGSKGLTWAVFETVATGERFAAISTHYWWQSDDAQDNLDRESNARESLDTVAAITAKYGCPVVLGGDFNCNPSSSPYGILTKGGLRDVQSWAKATENMHTHHTYPTFDSETGLWDDPVYPAANYARSIDHILATGALTPNRFDVVTDLYAVLSGDHCPLVLDFDIN